MATDLKKQIDGSGNQQTIKTVMIWGIPLIILAMLVILLILEITGGGPDSGVDSSDGFVELIQDNVEEISPATEDSQEQPFVSEETTETGDTETEETSFEEITETEETTSETEEIPTETIAIEETAPETEEILTETIAVEEAPDQTEISQETTEDDGISVIVAPGDSLWKIANRKVADPWQWKTILIQNKDKIDYTIISDDSGKWKVILDAGEKLKIKPNEQYKKRNLFSAGSKKKYALQLMSLNLDQLDVAVGIVSMLIKDGYYAYLYRTKEKIQIRGSKKKSYFYRIRTGFFSNSSEAEKVGEEIYNKYKAQKIFPSDFWPVLPNYNELNGELIDFGIQKTRPWVIQLSQSNQLKSAIAILEKVIIDAEFAYISHKKLKKGGDRYRIRVGFFENQARAEKALKQFREIDDFPKAKIVELKSVMESAPGQSTGASSKKKIKEVEEI